MKISVVLGCCAVLSGALPARAEVSGERSDAARDDGGAL